MRLFLQARSTALILIIMLMIMIIMIITPEVIRYFKNNLSRKTGEEDSLAVKLACVGKKASFGYLGNQM